MVWSRAGIWCSLPCQQQPTSLPTHLQEQQAEPSFELPERLQEYSGPANDRKALMQWRQEQQVGVRSVECVSMGDRGSEQTAAKR